MLVQLEVGAIRALRRRGVELPWTEREDQAADLLAHAIGQFWLDEISPSSLPAIARIGVDVKESSPARNSLAGLAEGTEDAVILEVVGAVMAELGYANSYQGGVALFCDFHLNRIASGVVHPYLGAASLRWAERHAEVSPDQAISVFSELANQWDSTPAARERVESEIFAEAKGRQAVG